MATFDHAAASAAGQRQSYGDVPVRPEAVLLSWSGGKDSALALARLRQSPELEVVGLLTTVTTGYERISIHGVRRTLLQRQSEAVRLPVHEIEIEPQSSNEAYEAAWAEALQALPRAMAHAHTIAFGDIFLEDVRRNGSVRRAW